MSTLESMPWKHFCFAVRQRLAAEDRHEARPHVVLDLRHEAACLRADPIVLSLEPPDADVAARLRERAPVAVGELVAVADRLSAGCPALGRGRGRGPGGPAALGGRRDEERAQLSLLRARQARPLRGHLAHDVVLGLGVVAGVGCGQPPVTERGEHAVDEALLRASAAQRRPRLPRARACRPVSPSRAACSARRGRHRPGTRSADRRRLPGRPGPAVGQPRGWSRSGDPDRHGHRPSGGRRGGHAWHWPRGRTEPSRPACGPSGQCPPGPPQGGRRWRCGARRPSER